MVIYDSLRKEETIMKFETPIVDVKKFDVKDILTASGCPADTPAPACPYDVEGPCPDD